MRDSGARRMNIGGLLMQSDPKKERQNSRSRDSIDSRLLAR
ncbi:hypothetical protein C7402_102133 [Paraburkholderia unamae]|uniref:Uncharacterized protein n=1 Tax=Paraburkholderia unamae TaxID=219649 RepID=A0ABX5KVQ0_9BURK|nr:hypothetical protein C7402_102133 [Paraburkholderia unamae]RAR68157.1 hypothetical protein C7401_101396 [Paraburkholderia unamae]